MIKAAILALLLLTASASRSEQHLEIPSGFAGTVLVARGGHVLLFKGFGRAGGKPIKRDDRFWIASSGKQFVAAAIMLLVEQGRVHLDDPLSKWFRDAPGDKKAITVRQLLAHMSGLDQSYVSEEQTERRIAVRKILAEPLAGPAGEKFRYSNSNIQLAAAIVEEASGQTYAQFVKDRLWRPAGLLNTGFAGSPGARLVRPIQGDLPVRLRKSYWGEQGIYSNATDMFRWYRSLIAGHVLKAASLDVMFKPVVKIGEGQAALGWFLGRDQRGNDFRFVRGNEDFGANSLLYAFPKSDFVIIVLTHAGDRNDETSWSRAVLESLQQQLRL